MNRSEAVSVLKQIMGACMGIPYVAIVPPNSDSVLSKGYQVHIKARPLNYDRDCIEMIALRNQLSLADDKERLVIYKPIKLNGQGSR